MKISYRWLQQLLPIDKTAEELGKDLTLLGLEVEAISAYEQVKGSLAGVVVGHVLSAEQHPNAERLKLTRVDVGTGEPLRIVCGAPNVAAGQKVAVALVGTTLYPAEGEPITLKKSKIRGEDSEGMICALDELGLGSDHSGIVVLDDKWTVGTPAATVFGLNADQVIEIGLTPNRTDAMSHYGVARDLAAFYRLPLELPTIPNATIVSDTPELPVVVADPTRCPRYSGLVVRGVQVGPSPDWLQQRLLAVGQRPINNVVDVTNYILHELGQPLHAFDLAEIQGVQITVRTAGPVDAEFVTLDGQKRTLTANDLLICDAQRGLCLAGIMGGLNSGVSTTTKDIFLESAYFQPATIRKSSRKLDLHTETSYRFARGTDPNITNYALQRAAQLLAEVAGGVAGTIHDQAFGDFSPREVPVRLSRIRHLAGHELPDSVILDILERLEIRVSGEGDARIAHVPLYRVDVTREQDLAEEVLRVYGYNNIPNPKSIPVPLTVYADATGYQLRQFMGTLLAGMGYREVLNNSLTAEAFADETAVHVLNPLSEALNVMRTSMLPSMLEVLAHNRNRQMPDVQLYELGRTYHWLANTPVEREEFAILRTGAERPEHWEAKPLATNYFNFKRDIEHLLDRLGLEPTWQTILAETDAELGYGETLEVPGKTIGRFGSVNLQAPELKSFELKQEVFFASFDLAALRHLAGKRKVEFRELPRFPAVRRDISLMADESVTFGELDKTIRACNPKLIRGVTLFDVYQPKDSAQKSYAMALSLQDERQTLTDDVVDKLMARVFQALEKDTRVNIRRA
jgi:phenylalanyl-tRNA synthetase beta chain